MNRATSCHGTASHGGVVRKSNVAWRWWAVLCICLLGGCAANENGAASAGAGENAVAALTASNVRYAPARAGETLFGFTPFPYDFTVEAVNNTHSLIKKHGTIYAVQLDNGVPWKEAAANSPWPDAFQQEWSDMIKAIPRDRPLFVSIAPLDDDRQTLLHPAEGSSMPAGFTSAPLDDARIKDAYLNYVRRVIAEFRPDYLNLGQEAGQLAHKDAGRWKQFVELYRATLTAVRKEHPDIKIGISFGLQSFLTPKTFERSQDAVEISDYVGFSIYPYVDELTGNVPSLSEPPQAWRKLFDEAAKKVKKPIAICETGYNTVPASLNKYHLSIPGSEQLQADYVRDLFSYARRDKWLFVVWFCVVDFDRLYEKLPAGAEYAMIWRNTGLIDKNLKPKPAWDAWRKGLAASQEK